MPEKKFFIPQFIMNNPSEGVRVEWPYSHNDYAVIVKEKGLAKRYLGAWRHSKRRNYFEEQSSIIEQGLVTYSFFHKDNVSPKSVHASIDNLETGGILADFRHVIGESLTARFYPIRSAEYDRSENSFGTRQEAADYLGKVIVDLLEKYPEALQTEKKSSADLISGGLREISKELRSENQEGRDYLLGQGENIDEFLSKLVKDSTASSLNDKFSYYIKAMKLLKTAKVSEEIKQSINSLKEDATISELFYFAVSKTVKALSDFKDQLDGIDHEKLMICIFQDQGIKYGYRDPLNSGFPAALNFVTQFVQWGVPINMPGGFSRTFDKIETSEEGKNEIIEKLDRNGVTQHILSFPENFSVKTAYGIGFELESDFSEIGKKIIPLTLEGPRTEAVFSTRN